MTTGILINYLWQAKHLELGKVRKAWALKGEVQLKFDSKQKRY